MNASRVQRAADEQRDYHPRRRSFPRGLHLRLRWRCIWRLQFDATGTDIHSELFPVHSPLLRESCLVSFPPLTYMLKFGGFADLTSCLVKKAAASAERERTTMNQKIVRRRRRFKSRALTIIIFDKNSARLSLTNKSLTTPPPGRR